jgi:hypothetical protein
MQVASSCRVKPGGAFLLGFEFTNILFSPGTLEHLLGKDAARGGMLFAGIAP